MKRRIIVIDEQKCNGCGLCIPECHEGALQIIDGKARLISDLFCDGLGACIGHCPEGALTIEEREAEPYDEIKVIERMADKGENTILAHLRHLNDHGEKILLGQAVDYLDKMEFEIDLTEFRNNESNLQEIVHSLFGTKGNPGASFSGVGACPGTVAREFESAASGAVRPSGEVNPEIKSELRQWPVQMHLVNPAANWFRGADVVLTADCVAYAVGDFHRKYLKGNSLVIACPKLDSGTENYVSKLKTMMTDSNIRSLTILRMEVPCCGGLTYMVQAAASEAGWNTPVKELVISVHGDQISEKYL